MANPWDSISPATQAELEGYAGNTGSEFRDALLSSAANAYADMGNAYQSFLTGRNMPPTPTAVTMETTTTTSEPLDAPQTMQSALLQAGAAAGREQEAEHWRDYARDHAEEDRQHSYPNEAGEDDGLNARAGADPGAGSDPTSGMEAYRAAFNAAPGSEAGQGSYGVGQPSQGAQPTQDTQQTTPEQDHGPEL